MINRHMNHDIPTWSWILMTIVFQSLWFFSKNHMIFRTIPHRKMNQCWPWRQGKFTNYRGDLCRTWDPSCFDCFVVEPYPSEKWWSESQLGLWNSQLNGKKTCSKPPTSNLSLLLLSILPSQRMDNYLFLQIIIVVMTRDSKLLLQKAFSNIWCVCHGFIFETSFPECVARVPVSLWGSGGWGCVRSTLRSRAQPSATVRNRSQPSATVRTNSVWPCLWEVLQRWSFLEVADASLLRFAWQAWHFVTFRRVLQRVESRFAWQAQYFCDVFRRCVAVFVAGAALWTCPSSFFVAGAAL